VGVSTVERKLAKTKVSTRNFLYHLLHRNVEKTKVKLLCKWLCGYFYNKLEEGRDSSNLVWVKSYEKHLQRVLDPKFKFPIGVAELHKTLIDEINLSDFPLTLADRLQITIASSERTVLRFMALYDKEWVMRHLPIGCAGDTFICVNCEIDSPYWGCVYLHNTDEIVGNTFLHSNPLPLASSNVELLLYLCAIAKSKLERAINSELPIEGIENCEQISWETQYQMRQQALSLMDRGKVKEAIDTYAPNRYVRQTSSLDILKKCSVCKNPKINFWEIRRLFMICHVCCGDEPFVDEVSSEEDSEDSDWILLLN